MGNPVETHVDEDVGIAGVREAAERRGVVVLRVATLRRRLLSRARLARDVIAGDLAVLSGARLHDRAHHIGDLSRRARGDGAPARAPLDLLAALRGEEVRGHERATVGHRGERPRDLDHRHGDGLTERHRSCRRPIIVLVRLDDSRRLSGVVDTRLVADAKGVHALREGLGTDDVLDEVGHVILLSRDVASRPL